MATWHTPASVRDEWPDAEQISDPTLIELLAVAQAQVIAYAPAVADSTPVSITLDSGTGAKLTLTRTGKVVTGVLFGTDGSRWTPIPDGFRSNGEYNVVVHPELGGRWVSVDIDWSGTMRGNQISAASGIPDGTEFSYFTDDGAGEGIPDAWRLAQRMQARNLFTASAVDASGAVGDGTFVVRPHPLDWHVKAILRPKAGVPVVG